MRSARQEEEDGQLPAKISAAFRVVETLGAHTRKRVTRGVEGMTCIEGRPLDMHEKGAHNAALNLLRNWLNGETDLATELEEQGEPVSSEADDGEEG